MISANCLVFPKPRLADPKLIEVRRKQFYIPKDVKQKHFYSSPKAHDDLSCTSSPTARSQLNPNSTTFRFHCISSAKQRKHTSSRSAYIPCVYIKGVCHQNKLIVYFHSNGEDLISAFNFVYAINVNSGRSVLMMEYPGYSVYKQKHTKTSKEHQLDNNYYNQNQTTAEEIERDAAKVIQYMKQSVGYQLKDITVLGRSIGSGPAIYVASIYPVGSLVLLSPFLSLKEAVKDLYGSFLAALLVERFNNKERVKLIRSPCLLIHGIEDTIIPYIHSVELNKEFKSFTVLKLVEKMKHNSFHFHKEFLDHVKQFLCKIETNHQNSYV